MFTSLSQKLQTILLQAINKTDDGISIFDQQDNVAYCNLSFAKLFGFDSVEDIMKLSFTQIITNSFHSDKGVNVETDDIQLWLQEANRKRRSRPHRSFEIDTKDGRWFLITEQVVEDFLFLYATNITASKLQQFELLNTQQQLASLAATDSLTGICNRRHFFQLANKELFRCQHTDSPVSILMIDIDHFKLVNDNYGHACGDTVLEYFTKRISRELRNYDIFARIGGEEFAVLLPETDSTQALDIAERCRNAIESAPFYIENASITITTSIGVSSYQSDNDSLETIMKSADDNLYSAKISGRNKVCN